MSEFGMILDLVLKLINTLSPDEISQIKKAIEKKEKENEEIKDRLKKALQDFDIPALTAIFNQLFGL